MDNTIFFAILGSIPFFLMLFGLWLSISFRAKERQIRGALLIIRSRLRSYQQNIKQYQQEALAYSPNDPDPFGELSSLFNSKLVELENSLKQMYEEYGELHRRARIILPDTDWKKWVNFFQLPHLLQEVELFEAVLERIEEQYQQIKASHDKLLTLGNALSRNCREVIEQLQDTRLILQGLNTHLTGAPIEACRRSLESWSETLKIKIPVSFYTSGSANGDALFQKEDIIIVHRILNAAVPEISVLAEKVKKWNDDVLFVISAIPAIKNKQIELESFLHDLESKIDMPVSWDISKELAQSIQVRIDHLSSIKYPYPLESLRELMHSVKWVIAQQAGWQKAGSQFLSDYSELSNLWSSMELLQGTVWIKSVVRVLDNIGIYDEANWQSIDNLTDFRSKFARLAQYQASTLPPDPSRLIQESILGKLLDETRNLFVLHQNLRPRFDRIHERFKNLQSLHDVTQEKLDRAKSILGKTLPMISSNPLLRRSAGKDPEKFRVGLENLLLELDAKEGLIEKKAQKVDFWIEKAEQAINKWLDVLANDLDDHLARLGDAFQSLGYFLNIQDLVITESKEILKKIEAPERFGQPLNRPGDSLLFVAAKKLWATNDDWQKAVSVERALADIANPVIERYKKVEKSRELLLSQVAKGEKLIPAELQWPPTAQNLELERKQYQNLERDLQALRQEPIQAIQLVGKLSDLSTQFNDVAARFSQKIEKAEQEQSRIFEYERKLDETKRLWLAIVEKYPEYKTLRRDIEKLFNEIDGEYESLRKQYILGGLPYSQALHGLRMLNRKINEITMPAVGNQVVDINGELQKRLF